MDRWEFLQQGDGCWTWQHINCVGARRASRVSFAARADCIANALYHGYMAENPQPVGSAPWDWLHARAGSPQALGSAAHAA